RLEGTIPESLLQIIERTVPAPDLPLLMGIARLAVWEHSDARAILQLYLMAAASKGMYSISDTTELLHLVESRKPASVADLVAQIPVWREALQQQIDVAGGSKPFFDANLQALHGGERDQRRSQDPRLQAKQNELAFLRRLQQLL